MTSVTPTVDELLARSHIPIVAKPGARRSEILGVRNDALHVALAAPPEDGKANEELLKLLRRETGSRFELVVGGGSRRKMVRRVA